MAKRRSLARVKINEVAEEMELNEEEKSRLIRCAIFFVWGRKKKGAVEALLDPRVKQAASLFEEKFTGFMMAHAIRVSQEVLH